MKRVRVVALLCAGPIALAACGGGGSPGGITYVGYGGVGTEVAMSSWADPFSKVEGVAVVSDGPTDYAKIKAQVESGNVVWDVVMAEPYFAINECGTLLEPIDTDVVGTGKLPPEYVTECAVPAFASTYFLAYSDKVFGTSGPKTWMEFFDTTRFPGKRAVYNAPTTGVYESALIADGVRPEDLYPLDLDRATRKLESLGDDLIFYNTGAEQQQLMESGEVVALHAWTARLLDANKNGAGFVPVWGDNFQHYDVLTVPKGAKTDMAMKFIAYATGAEGQTAFAEALPYGPINSDATPDLTPEAQAVLANRLEARELGVVLDNQYYADNSDVLFDRWSAFTGGYGAN